jgi:hypothetical protein
MSTDDLTLCDDVSVGAWIAPRLGGNFGAVTRTVPSGFAAYARILHPATDLDRPVAWAEVAETTGRQVHARVQWHALVGSPDPFNFRGSLWHGGNPARGNLAPELLRSLCAVLGQHTGDAEHCFFGVWEGYGDPELQRLVASHPRLKLPDDRAYLLVTGSLSAAPDVWHLWLAEKFRFVAQSPNLIWPSDRAWFLASEIDFDSTLVGGTPDLIQDILDSPALESWPVKPDDSLAFDADQINTLDS